MEQRNGRGHDPDDRGPGAHSGQESPAQERVIPGTGSAAEGYSSDGGTRQGDPLAGVEAEPEDAEETERPVADEVADAPPQEPPD
jgi:hypothetical protein